MRSNCCFKRPEVAHLLYRYLEISLQNRLRTLPVLKLIKNRWMITHKLSLLLLSSALLEPPGPTATRPVTFINIRSVLGWMRTINPQLYWLHNNKRLKNNNNKVKRTSLMAQKKKKKSPPQCPSVRSEWPLDQLVVVRARVGDVSCVNDGSVGTQHVLRARAPHSSAGLAVWTCRRVPLLLFVGCFFFFFLSKRNAKIPLQPSSVHFLFLPPKWNCKRIN